MEKVLYFLSNYNAQIIQAGFAVVFLLIIVYVYRAFFMAGSLSGESADVAHSPAIEQKLNQILEIQRSKMGQGVAVSAAASASSASLSQNAEEEIDKLKAEIYNLRQQVKDVEKNSAAVNDTGATRIDVADGGADSSPATKEMVVKVKELESRLAEYEIIADDIAELSQLRADNAKLKEQLSQMQEASAPAEILEPEAVDAEIAAAKVTEEKTATAGESKASATVSNTVAEDLSGQAAIDALFASAVADLPPEPVAASEQNLITDFEKTTQKKEDE